MSNFSNWVEYQIHAPIAEAHFISISISFTSSVPNPALIIPAWRPGRYMLQNFAANIRDWKAVDVEGNGLVVEKTLRNAWTIHAPANTRITFSYLYYCRQMDAGGCWNDPSLFYINPVACCMHPEGRLSDPCELILHLPAAFKIATGLKKQGNVFVANDYYELADCPVMACEHLTTLTYQVNDIPFQIHSNVPGDVFPEQMLNDFNLFTQAQINDFGSFPEKDYHFLLLILPYQHYHGVEHRNSTVICLGPSQDVKDKLYTELLGICSHELLHAWNICKIRPAELNPYDFSGENYFNTGFVAEGFTTYLGDHYLASAHVLSPAWYEEELNTMLQRHFYSFGNNHLSIADSSFDLWVDGYEAGIPQRKVSIYVKGSVIAFLMDVAIRSCSNHSNTIKSLLNDLWQEYLYTGRGYTETQVEKLFHSYTNDMYLAAFRGWIYGTGDLKTELIHAFEYLQCRVTETHHKHILAARYGLLCDTHYSILSIDPASPFLARISKGDKILSINQETPSAFSEEVLLSKPQHIMVISNGLRQWEEVLSDSDERYFKTLRVQVPNENFLLI